MNHLPLDSRATISQQVPYFDNMTRIEDDVTSVEKTESNMSPRDLTVIVAATSKMGIGRGGTLPWTGLKKEMAYFARVTKRANPGVCPQPFELLEIVSMLMVYRMRTWLSWGVRHGIASPRASDH